METNSRISIVAVVCMLIAGLSAAASAKVIYVDDDAAGANNGTSWANAYLHLQKALAAAGSGDEIRVARGIYRPDKDVPVPQRRGGATPGSATAVFQLKNGVEVKGGFAGIGAEDPDARDVQRYETILSGDLNGDDVDGWGLGHPMEEFLWDDNSEYVVHGDNTNSTAVLDGFVIQSAAKSGMINRGGSPHVANCTFRRNLSRDFSGGALHCEGGQPTFSNCVFLDNSAKVVGGAIHATQAKLTLSDCQFINNWAYVDGGAICSAASDLLLTGCTFEKNAGRQGGAIYQQQGTLSLTDCEFEGNMASEQGGAVTLVLKNMVSMSRCTFRRNWTPHLGGAICNEGSPLTLSACAFSGNQAGYGGALHTNGTSFPSLGSQPGDTIMTHCLFTGNHASSTGGALWAYRVGFVIEDCTFADNWASMGSTLGLPTDTVRKVTMENCIVWDDKKSITAFSSSRPPRRGEIPQTEPLNVAIRYSDVQGGWSGEGNLDADPCFAAPGRWVNAADRDIIVSAGSSDALWIDGDYHLKSQAGRWDPQARTWVMDKVTSPCIDAGDPKTPVGDEPAPNGDRINMGAYGGTTEASKSVTTSNLPKGMAE